MTFLSIVVQKETKIPGDKKRAGKGAQVLVVASFYVNGLPI